MPPDRAWIDSTRSASRSWPAIARSCCAEFAPVERRELQALDPARPVELGEERQERVASVQLVGSVGQDERHADVAQVPDEEAEQVAGRPVGPVEVLDDEDDRRDRREPVEDAEQHLEQAALRRARVETGSVLVRGRAEVGDEAGEVGAAIADDGIELVGREPAHEAAKRLDDGGVRQGAVTEDDAAAAEDHAPRRGRRSRRSR